MILQSKCLNIFAKFLIWQYFSTPKQLTPKFKIQFFIFRSPNNCSKMNKDNPKKKESVVDLSRFIDQQVRVKFQGNMFHSLQIKSWQPYLGGREACGTLKGYDTLLNLVLDNCVEFLRDPDDAFRLSGETRALGLIVARGYDSFPIIHAL